MPVELWIAFVVASAALLAIPGPTVTVVVGHSVAHGRRAALATVPGVVLGDWVAMSASLAGAGALLASSATLFTVMKWAGAAYLIWLGLRMWKADHSVVEAKIRERRALLSVFRKCFVVTALNPKDILFFVAFVPQFVDANAPFGPQVVILQATFLSMVAINIAFWSLSAGQLRDTFANPNRMKLLNRFGGGCLISAGALAART